jgi:transposase
LAETGDVRRFSSAAAFAMHAGTAPIPASSGNTQRFRLNRGGNRKLNAAIHASPSPRNACTNQPAPTWMPDAPRETATPGAIRALKRYIARRVYNLLKTAPSVRTQQAA